MHRILFFITFIIFTMIAAACSGGETPINKNINNQASNSPASNNNAVTFNPTPKPEGTFENDAPTLAPVVKTYYEALKKKDDALLRTVLSQSLIKEVETEMKDENKKGMAAYMAELDRVPEKEIEVRNEKINGDKGTAELQGGTYVKWSSIPFVKEDGKWKMTNGSTETESLKPTDMPSNTAK